MSRSIIASIVFVFIGVLSSTVRSESEIAQGPLVELPPSSTTDGTVVQEEGVALVQLGGYGEMHYNATIPEKGARSNGIDFHRFVLYVGKKLSENIQFYSEIEIEHAIVGDGKVGEVAIEQAYIDYQLWESRTFSGGKLGIRTGIILVPMGIINQTHEPSFFHGVERPQVDKLIIPSTWREAGMGITYKPSAIVSTEIYILSGLNPMGFSSKGGIRGGRQKAGKARTDGLAITGRVQVEPTPQIVLGTAAYFSQTGKNSDFVDASVPVLGAAIDGRFRHAGIEARGEFAFFSIGDSDKLGALKDAEGASLVDVSDRLLGGYLELAYDVFHREDVNEQQLLPFVRGEYYSTDPDDKTRSAMDLVAGLTYRPIPQLAFKQDVIFRCKGGDTDGDNVTIFNLGIGFQY